MDMLSNLESSREILKNIVKHLSSDTLTCIKNCTEVHQLCEQTISHCLGKGGMHAEVTHIRALRDVADISALTTNFMLRESPMHYVVCMSCAETCLVCAQSCERFQNDSEMKSIGDACRYCAESCEKMAMHH